MSVRTHLTFLCSNNLASDWTNLLQKPFLHNPNTTLSHKPIEQIPVGFKDSICIDYDRLFFWNYLIFSKAESWHIQWDLSRIRDCNFWGKKWPPKRRIPRHLLVWKRIKRMKSTCFFHTLLFMSTIVHEITHKVHKFLRKYISFWVVFWKKYDTRKKIPRPPIATNFMYLSTIKMEKIFTQTSTYRFKYC